MNYYLQPDTFYLIVWLACLLLAAGAGFLLGFLLRDHQRIKPLVKTEQLANRNKIR
ncbi:hypothetical protein [Spirosoma oryzicola]|uniref:hypothetical protein n=1 Tax=Spirosoma oryzicola TaxID=2898794 RepID=UPI001E312AEC|nr:hypothetical protein [Spirosoma oryzicola]UHG90251.1 hypothetical protein LQ777_18595 [Spirosoma oryzicola]